MDTAFEKTLALIKPDAVGAGSTEHILQIIELNDFSIITRARVHLTPLRAAAFYAEHEGKPFFDTLVDFMSSGPLLALVLAKPQAITSWRSLMGPTNSEKAREAEPDCIRAKFGTDGTKNATHGSDSQSSALREIRFFFPRLVLDPFPDGPASKKFVINQLQPTLVKGLTELCKAKPTADKLEAITWIAHWLLDNNPNKPRPTAADAKIQKVLDEMDELEITRDVGGADQKSIEEMEEELAATRLQSHYRGYLARKSIGEPKHAEAPTVVVQTHEMTEENAAATKVQSIYRGHATRKSMRTAK
mmetsp:Transcript_32618/g.45260  ORF Transcript_32618/g.45260 Transcript_32618/m.45260 type:complete len:303 (-) Transcript_32618:154-1062(-)|eukprot:CAMPEP_0196582782 /NCGR_PEP_ID=MMETSP1081-20130531/40627_1 /TAXON_ID=36882 /ORGANISM="Pyramimonas amylifera, Strain CCMP720" /LENGTH=302 /DNA_ID=CAMNT_0041903459 /DNA_START=289 /DNA_END=1197 /DNA_ORIENTATION=+